MATDVTPPVTVETMDERAKEAATWAVQSAVDALARRGYLKTETWALIVGGLLTAALARVGVPGDIAVQVVSIAAPLVVAIAFSAVQTIQKRALATIANSHLGHWL